jgi:predicted nucleic acid-binding protein
VQILVDSSVWIDYFTGARTAEADKLDSLLCQFPLVVADVVMMEKSAVNFHTLRAWGIPVRTAECRIATFCLDQGYALLHSSPEHYGPFEKYLGLQVAR